ncbi:MAG: FtsX-like permease family protein [Candidatus Latescibacteria bacterium]|nr:FtsX-like permease family protein [Candidatus Latescibacterota bacterium]
MFKNYLAVAVRNLLRHRLFSAINTLGLAFGLACFALMAAYVYHELHYDAFHPDGARIYRLYASQNTPQGQNASAQTPNVLGGTLRAELPQLGDIVRFWESDYQLSAGNEVFVETVAFTDPDFFEVFSFPLLSGNSHQVLQSRGIALSQRLARKLFGHSDPTGQTVTLNGQRDFIVTGVLEDVPPTSSLVFDALLAFDHLDDFIGQRQVQAWHDWGTQTYIRLGQGVTPDQLVAQLPGLLQRHLPKFMEGRLDLGVQALRQIHLDPEKHGGQVAAVSRTHLYILLGIACFVLLIACLNSVNLATVRYAERLREIGLRKVLGAQRGQIVYQFLGESLILGGLAVVLACVFVGLGWPRFTAFVGKELLAGPLSGASFFLSLSGLGLLAGALAGFYPAILLSRWQPIDAVKGLAQVRQTHRRLRQTLIVVQFSIAAALIIGGAAIHRQVRFMQDLDPGFRPDQLLVVPTQVWDLTDPGPQIRSFVADLETPAAAAGIVDISVSEHVPGQVYNNKFGVVPEGQAPGEPIEMFVTSIDHRFLDLYGLSATGSAFAEFHNEQNRLMLISQTGAAHMGWDDPVGRSFRFVQDSQPYQVIGVVPDIHFQSVHTQVGPLLYRPATQWHHMRYVTVRVASGRLADALTLLQNAWGKAVIERPFDYFVLDDHLARQYDGDRKTARLIGVFAGLAIALACLGLVGLVAMTVQQRLKELGIRKVLGASMAQIALLIAQPFTRLVLWANLISWPIAYWALDRWLQGFAYRIDLPWDAFALGGLSTLTATLAATGLHVAKATRANPVEILRDE